MRLFDPAKEPALGRLLGLDERYRLRDLDEELDELPEGLHFDVLDETGLDEPLVTNREALLVATEAGRALLEGAGLEVAARARAGERALYLFRPADEVNSDTTGESEDEPTGYGRLARADGLSVDDALNAPVALVSETRVFALDDALVADLEAAGLSRGLQDTGAPYAPAPESDWFVVVPGGVRKAARFESVQLEGADTSALPDHNPIAPERQWSAANEDKRVLWRLYATGAPLPNATFTQAKPKANKKVPDLAELGYLVVSPAALAIFAELGIEGDQAPARFLTTDGKPMKPEGHALFRAAPRALIDWRQSDVNWTGSNTIWGFRELELAPLAFDDEPPGLCHVAGTRLHLARRRFVDAVETSGLQGFGFIPVSTYGYAWNLDDELTDWRL